MICGGKAKIIEKMQVSRDEAYRVERKWNGTKVYSVKSAYDT